MFNYTELFTPHHIAVLVDWLGEKGELCVEIYAPHSGGGPSYHTVHSLAELKGLVSLKWPEIIITIWKNHNQAEFQSDAGLPVADNLKWIYFHPDEVMYFAVQKNRNWSESYDKQPEKYRKEVEDWFS
jgi:hypothetical protein